MGRKAWNGDPSGPWGRSDVRISAAVRHGLPVLVELAAAPFR
jgi:hypothetical protein